MMPSNPFPTMRSKTCFISAIALLAFSLPVTAKENWNLEQAIDYALEHNPSIEIAALQVEQAEATIGQARSGYRPKVEVQSGYMATNQPMMAFGSILNQGAFDFGLDFNKPGTVDDLSLSGRIVYPLYTGGRRSAELNSAKSNKQLSEFKEKAARKGLKLAVIQAWHNILKNKAFLESQQSNEAALERSLEVAQNQYDAGKFLKTEVLNLEVRLAQAKESVLNASMQLELAQRQLLNLLGTEDTQLLSRFDFSPQARQDEVFAQLEPLKRDEISAMELWVQSATEQVKAAGSANKPNVNSFASYQYNRGFEMDGDGDSWMAGISLNYSVYSGGAVKNRVKEARAAKRSAEQALRQTQLAVELEQRNGEIAYRSALESVRVTSKMIQQAEESAELSRQRFEKGVILSSELIDVENRLTEARTRRAQAVANLQIAKAQYKLAMGHL
jgi:outer membrane protein TolC